MKKIIFMAVFLLCAMQISAQTWTPAENTGYRKRWQVSGDSVAAMVYIAGGSSISASVYGTTETSLVDTIGSTATQLSSNSTIKIVVYNMTPNSKLYGGGSGVTTSNAVPIGYGQAAIFEVSNANKVYLLSGGGNIKVIYKVII